MTDTGKTINYVTKREVRTTPKEYGRQIKEKLGKDLSENWKSLLFLVVCWYFGIKLFNLGYSNLDFSKPDEIKPLFLTISVVGLLLILLPFFKRVKVGEFELEREIEQAKKELSEIKNETRNSIAIMSSQITAVASIRNQNQVTVYVPGYEEAKAELRQNTSQALEQEAKEIKDEFLKNQDTAMAVLKIRVHLEYLLRTLLEKRRNVIDAPKGIKYMSLSQMTKEFFENYPDYRHLQKSFDYVREVGNAAAHAQLIPEYQAQEVLDIGTRLIAILTERVQQEDI